MGLKNPWSKLKVISYTFVRRGGVSVREDTSPKAVVSNSICLGAAESSYWVLPGRTEPFAKGNVN